MVTAATIILSPSQFIKALQGQDDRFISQRQLFMHGPMVKAIVFDDIVVNEPIYLSGNQSYAMYPVVITENARFNENFFIVEGNFLNQINIDGGVFMNGFTIRGGTFNEPFTIVGAEFHKLFSLLGGTFKAGFDIISGYFWNCTVAGIDCSLWFNIAGGNFRELSFSGKPKIERSINITGGHFHEISFGMETPNLVKIKGDDERFGINSLDISGLLMKENLFSFENIEINYIKFNNLINNGQLYFNNVAAAAGFIFDPGSIQVSLEEDSRQEKGKDLPQFELQNSDLGKATFIDCDLTQFHLQFKSSKINEVFLAGTKWFLPEHINAGATNINYQQDKLILSQTRKIHESLGDTVSSTEYYAREMNMHLLHLQQTKTKRGERFQLSLNKWSSNHGENWVQAISVLMSVGIMMYCIYCISITGFSLNLSGQGASEFLRRCFYFLEFLNPLHKADFLAERISAVKDFSPGAATVFFDGLSRIVFAYLIYQFIQAFRKHGRKTGG